MKWYCHIKGQQYGPVDEATLRSWISEGRILPDDLIWAEGMQNWVKAETFGVMTGSNNGGIAGTGGMTPCRDIRAKAREALTGKWGTCAMYMFLLGIISIFISLLTTYPPFFVKRDMGEPQFNWGQLILDGPFALGAAMFFLAVARGQEFSFGTLFAGFKKFFGALGLYWCMLIFILLWTLLFIIPGIIAAFSYAMAYYVYADNPGLGVLGSIKRSKELMRGHRLKYFWLNLTFLGWALLCIPTCGIGFLWLAPYIQTALAVFYNDIQQPEAACATEAAAPTNQPYDPFGSNEQAPAETSAPQDLSRPVNPQQ